MRRAVQTLPGNPASIRARTGKTLAHRHPGEAIMKSAAKRHALIGIAALVAVATANLAPAAEEVDVPQSTVVHYADLDLSRPKDAHRLYGRIRRAAATVCANHPDGSLERFKEYKKCLGKAVTEAVEKVQSEQVTAIHRARGQRLAKS
jgi:UrcA family protein